MDRLQAEPRFLPQKVTRFQLKLLDFVFPKLIRLVDVELFFSLQSSWIDVTSKLNVKGNDLEGKKLGFKRIDLALPFTRRKWLQTR